MPRTITRYAERRTQSVQFLGWINHRWLRRQREASKLKPQAFIAHLRLWLCIHKGEGAWNANTGNGYYGGLQMTISWGGLIYRADLHTPDEQMQAAETGYRQSGYSSVWLGHQWPNTSPPCLGYA